MISFLQFFDWFNPFFIFLSYAGCNRFSSENFGDVTDASARRVSKVMFTDLKG